MNTRRLCFANSAVTLSYPDGRPAVLVDYLFRRLADSNDLEAHIDLSLTENEAGRLALTEGGETSLATGSVDVMAEWVVSRVGFHLADKSRGGVLFHAAAAHLRGRAVVMPGRIGAGKTTLTCWLLAHGFGYLSDEFIFAPAGDERLSAFPRPLNVKRAALPAVEPYLQAGPPCDGILEGSASSLVPPERLSSREVLSQAGPGMILLPNYQSGSEFKLERLTAAQAGLMLMQTILNLRNLPTHGLPETARLVNRLPVYRLTYAGFAQLDENGFLDFLEQSLQN